MKLYYKKRLTKESTPDYYSLEEDFVGEDAIQKLGQLEDIEEELGIDLITLFKALKNGIYVKYDATFGLKEKPRIVIKKDKATTLCFREGKWWIQEEDELIKDYGKTWALTKEELL